jgi:hypothetical protein
MRILLDPQALREDVKIALDDFDDSTFILLKRHDSHGITIDIEVHHEGKVVSTTCVPRDGQGEEGKPVVIIGGTNG